MVSVIDKLPISSLSLAVHTLVTVTGQCTCNENYKQKATYSCYNEDFTLNWTVLQSVFPNDIPMHTSEWYNSTIRNLAPVFMRTSEELLKLSSHGKFLHKSKWTGKINVLKKCLNNLKDGNPILGLLLLTSTLERALGNVHLLKAKQVPFLLKDLLSSESLQETFGKCAMQLLQVLMGSPSSLNLRNIVWHGFLSPEELPLNYCYFLLLLTGALGTILEEKQIRAEHIPHRPLLTLIQCEQFSGIVPVINNEQIDSIRGMLPSFEIISPQMLPCWMAAITSFETREFTDCVTLLLPQLENVLRRLFALANDCEERVVTAESSEFYITFDEILSQSVNNTENKLTKLIGDNLMMMLLDLLSLPCGPRLRDHLSHGEADTKCISLELANHVLYIATVTCLVARNRLQNDVIDNEFTMTLLHRLDSYEPIFAPHTMCAQQISMLIKSLDKWKTCHIILYEKNLLLGAIEQAQNEDSDFDNQIFCRINCNNLFSSYQLKQFLLVNADLSAALNLLADLRRPTILHRPQNEVDLLMCLKRIAASAVSVSEQIQDNIEAQTSDYRYRRMRSRNRVTYRRMIDTLPVILTGLRVTALILCTEYTNCQTSNLESKLFRCIVHYVDNLSTMTNPQKNRWEESKKLTADFISSVQS